MAWHLPVLLGYTSLLPSCGSLKKCRWQNTLPYLLSYRYSLHRTYCLCAEKLPWNSLQWIEMVVKPIWTFTEGLKVFSPTLWPLKCYITTGLHLVYATFMIMYWERSTVLGAYQSNWHLCDQHVYWFFTDKKNKIKTLDRMSCSLHENMRIVQMSSLSTAFPPKCWYYITAAVWKLFRFIIRVRCVGGTERIDRVWVKIIPK